MSTVWSCCWHAAVLRVEPEAMLSNEAIGVLSLLATVVCYAINKQLYRKYPHRF